MAVTEALRQSIILGAVGMSGEVGDDASAFEARVKANAKRLTGMLSEHSPVAKTIDMIDDAKKFPATILYLGKEPKTNRAFVVLKTKPSDDNPDGIETARTEIVDWEGKSGEAFEFAKQTRNLTGHRVFVYIELQIAKGTGRKVRILQHVEDLGEDTFITDADLEAGKSRAAKDMRV
jgi:hypothetical protein